ncbi:hypothetical protein G3M48_007319 [Beauveria asiatica]|uniref:Uncharacterized protein n=1 Tax=Beauveria asiatica TaxID=1069075 RepID=A0AAW0S3Z5_9HYPO
MAENQAVAQPIAQAPFRVIPVAMRGSGYYNQHAHIQETAMVKALSLFPDACRDGVFDEKLRTVVDYGASQGINSILPLSHFLELSAKNSARPIDIQYLLVDTPTNDFSSLARTMHPAIQEWAKNYPSARVFPRMIARSFYQQIIPDGQVHFGFSFSCLQWLSRFPQAHLADGEPNVTVDRVSLMSFRQNICRDQSDRDLHQFLQVRGNEFVPGGSLILSFPGSSSVCGYWETPVFKCLVLALDEMVADGLITLATANLFSPPFFTRDLQQVRAVLDSPEVKSVWSTMHLFEEDIEHPMSSNQARHGKSLEESTQYAQEMINFGLAIVAGFLMDAIRAHNTADSVTAAEEEELLVQWKTRAANIFLSQCPDARVSFRWVYVSLRRTAQAS